jgi:Cu(I)/Ag(I) efflux system membrane protein CusA/SilA
MIARIIEWSAKNPGLVLLGTLAAVLWGIYAVGHVPLDALPDLSDPQVIIYTEWPEQNPAVIEDQVTYPIVTTFLAAPRVQVVRGFSFFGVSFVYVIFEEGTDLYWARSRTLEYLQTVRQKLPPGVEPRLGPDATGLGWGFMYALVDRTGRHDLAQLRTLQDFYVKYALESVPGVAEVASLGGFVRQYQVTLDPNRLLAYRVSLEAVMQAIRNSNRETGARVLEIGGREYMIRARGYVRSLRDLEEVVVKVNDAGVPVRLRDLGTIQVGPEIRRGIAELNGEGEVVGGIVVVRYGQNVLQVVERVKRKLREIQPSLPPGVEVVVTYDRSDLIHKAIATLTDELMKISAVVSAVCLVFLLHLPSALVIITVLPVAVLMGFIAMYHLNISANIMSLGGIAIAMGALVDSAIIMVEQAHKRLEEWERRGRPEPRAVVIVRAAQEVGPSLFFALLVITVSFLPIFTLEAQEGRLFKPLAYTKTFSMLFASFVAITLTPVMMVAFIRGKIRPEERNPVSRLLHRIYEPTLRLCLRYRAVVLVAAVLAMASAIWAFSRLGREFMPPLWEESYLYMPVTIPGASVTTVTQLLQVTDRIIRQFPEVALVFGKAGRAETATDPAPLEMFETTILLKPPSQWRPGMTPETLQQALNDALQVPGLSNTWTLPIRNRIDMLTTGIRTPIGIKVFGPDLGEIERIGRDIEAALRTVPGTRNVFAERVSQGYYLDLVVNRAEAARYGLNVADVQNVFQAAVGGMNVTTTVEGRERYPVLVRYARGLRDDVEKLRRVLIDTPTGAQIPLSAVAELRWAVGPSMIKSEEGSLVGYVYVDMTGRDVGRYVEEAKRVVQERVKLPPGYRLEWSGQYEYMERVWRRMRLVVPLTLFIVVLLLYLNTRSVVETGIVLLAVPFSLIGAFWLLYLLGYNLSVAVWAGIIALLGLDAETGVVMLLYLTLSYRHWRAEGRLRSLSDFVECIMEGAVQRVRPKVMTVGTILAGLIPVLFASGVGADVWRRMAAPMVGGVVSSLLMELLVYPVLFYMWKRATELKDLTGRMQDTGYKMQDA